MEIMTVGYEGISISKFIDVLTVAGVEKVVDVRELPLSRKRGFSKRSLAALLNQHGIKYVHLRELGCPRPIRRDYHTDGDWRRYTIRYLQYLRTQDDAMQRLNDLVQHEQCCLLCFEADAERCHRSLVAHKLRSRQDTRLEVRHLRTIGTVTAA
jgi:uncharacterized protein (DUF488 family)